ncbi:MAG: hypothetical protein ABIZ34_05485 [Candidatus Limnocylindrales bacterium]
MSERLIRIVAAAIAFIAVVIVGVLLVGGFSASYLDDGTFDLKATNQFAVVFGAALIAAAITYFYLERRQTGRLDSISGQFGTRTLVLIPIAIGMNIVLGAAVANALKLPLYFDSVGTILVGVLCGPLAGAATGFLANILWTYVIPPPFQYQPAAAFAIVAAAIGLVAGLFGRVGWYRPRPNRSTGELAVAGIIAVAIVGAMAFYAYTRYYGTGLDIINPDNTDAIQTILGYVVLALPVIAIVGFAVLLFVRRDVTVAFVVVSGVVIGSMAALISAPIAANVFSGVTGSGVDFLVAAFRQAGSDLQTATLQQGLLVDPVDKMLTAVVVYIVVTSMARRIRARFPNGERLIEPEVVMAPPEPVVEAPA